MKKQHEKEVIGYLSGTFDLFHIGHLNIIKRASKLCNRLIVGVHRSTDFKRGKVFIPFEERIELIRACRYVDEVIEASDEDSTDWQKLHFDRLFVGGDYKGSERFLQYEDYFADKGVEIIYLPYTDSTSSTKLRALIEKELEQP